MSTILVDNLHWPAVAQQVRTVIMDSIRAEVKDDYKDYLGTLRPGFPKNITELALKGLELKSSQGEFKPHPSV